MPNAPYRRLVCSSRTHRAHSLISRTLAAVGPSVGNRAHFVGTDYRHYDLVITDIRMTQLNGFELYQQLKTLDPNLQIIFVTALDIAQEITTLLPEVKLNQFLIKPVNPSVLINSVKQHAKRYIEGA